MVINLDEFYFSLRKRERKKAIKIPDIYYIMSIPFVVAKKYEIKE